MSRNVIVFDFETLGVVPWESMVLSLGVVACDWDDVQDTREHVEALKERGLHIFFGLKEQKKLGRTVDPDTMDWWEQQGEDAQFIFSEKPRRCILDLPNILGEYCKREGVDKNTMVLIRAPHFDFPFMCSLYEASGLKQRDLPFSHWKVRDSRTIIDMCDGSQNGKFPGFSEEMKKKHGLIKHNALHDVIIDLLECKKALEQ